MPVETMDDRWRITATRSTTYEVIYVDDLLSHARETATDVLGGPECAARGRRRLVVMDEEVQARYGKRWAAYFGEAEIDACIVVIPGGEAAKSEKTCELIMRAMVDAKVSRDAPMIVIGGGVAHDVGGHASNRFQRGVTEWIFVATTLLAILDAGYGWKVGANRFGIKNLDGGFKPAKRGFLCPAFAASLDERRISDALAEATKVALMVEPILLDDLIEFGPRLVRNRFQAADDLPSDVIRRVVNRAIEPMLVEQSQNPDVRQPERWPEFGHDAGKRWEMRLGGTLYHGETVALNCALLTQVAYDRRDVATGRRLLSKANRDRALKAWTGVDLPIYHSVMENSSDMVAGLESAELMRRGQAIPVPVDLIGPPRGRGKRDIGCQFLYDITADEGMRAVRALRELASAR